MKSKKNGRDVVSRVIERARPKADTARSFINIDAFWRFFVSVRLTIGLLIGLTALSIAGTLIAQQGTTQVPIEKLYSASTLKFLYSLGLTDIYHSGIFVSLLLMLALNLISCSIERLPAIWKQAFHVAPPPITDMALSEWDSEEARKRKYLLERPGKGDFKSVKEAKMVALLFFQKRFGKYVVLRDGEDEFQVMLEQGKYSRLGVYITHLSLLLIFFGGALGSIFGLEGGMSIEEGSKQSWMQHIKGSRGGFELMRENGVPVPNFLNLGFEVECEKFTLETYDGERPKAFRSRLNFYENDVKVQSSEITVNHPTVYKGLTFYQASFNESGVGGATLKLFRMEGAGQESPKSREPLPDTSSIDRGAGRNPASQDGGSSPAPIEARGVPPEVKSVMGGMPLSQKTIGAPSGKAPSLLPGGVMPKVNSVEQVEDVRPGELYRVDGDAAFKLVTLEPNLLDLGPAAKVQFFKTKQTKKPEEFWIFKNLPGFDFAHRKQTPLHFVLEGLKPRYATGLSVARDPGVWVVWIGSAILVLALFLALYTCHSRYWVAYTKEHGFVVVGWSNKLFLFEPRFEAFYAAFRNEFTGRSES